MPRHRTTLISKFLKSFLSQISKTQTTQTLRSNHLKSASQDLIAFLYPPRKISIKLITPKQSVQLSILESLQSWLKELVSKMHRVRSITFKQQVEQLPRFLDCLKLWICIKILIKWQVMPNCFTKALKILSNSLRRSIVPRCRWSWLRNGSESSSARGFSVKLAPIQAFKNSLRNSLIWRESGQKKLCWGKWEITTSLGATTVYHLHLPVGNH